MRLRKGKLGGTLSLNRSEKIGLMVFFFFNLIYFMLSGEAALS